MLTDFIDRNREKIVTISGVRRKDNAARAIKWLHNRGILAFWRPEDRSLNVYITDAGRELCAKWAEQALAETART